MFHLLFGSFLLRELPVPFTGYHDITPVWAGSQPPAFAAQPHALILVEEATLTWLIMVVA